MRQLHRRCAANTPTALDRLVTAGYRSIPGSGPAGASYLAVMRSLAAGAASTTNCARVGRDFAAELAGPARSSAYGRYAATTTAWSAAHRADASHGGGYLPKLANGDDSFVIGGGDRVTTLTRNFDPPLSQPLAIASIRSQLLPGQLHSVYTLPTANCYEVIYLSPGLGRLLSSSALGVMIELTSGRGVASHYDTGTVDRAILTVGGRIGGQPCV